MSEPDAVLGPLSEAWGFSRREGRLPSDAEIAALLGTSRGTIAVTLFRIRARLRTLLRTATVGSQGEKK